MTPRPCTWPDGGRGDLDLIVGHSFESTGQWDDVCERLDTGGWMCGYARAEHGDHEEAETVDA